MTDNRYLRGRDMRRGRGRDMADNKYTRYRGYLERQDNRRMDSNTMPQHQNYVYQADHTDYKPYDMNYYDQVRGYDMRPNDYGYDGHESSEMKFKEDLKRWTEKLKRKDRFKMSKEDIANSAKQMGVRFDEFSEDEFYVVYLMQVSDHPQAYNEPRAYIARAKEWLMDDDVEVSPSEKLCIYYYEIVKGEGLND